MVQAIAAPEEDWILRIGLQVPRFTWRDGPGNLGARLAEIGRTASEAGFASLWVVDHFFQIRYVRATEEPSWRATAL